MVLAIDCFCLCMYIIESFMRIVGEGFYNYYENQWNKFDFYMIFFSLATLILQYVLIVSISSKVLRLSNLNRLVKSVRILRSARLLKFTNQGFREIFFKIILCIPNITNLIPIILSCFYIWSIVGLV